MLRQSLFEPASAPTKPDWPFPSSISQVTHQVINDGYAEAEVDVNNWTQYKVGDLAEVIADHHVFQNMKGRVGRVSWVHGHNICLAFSLGQQVVTRTFLSNNLEPHQPDHSNETI